MNAMHCGRWQHVMIWVFYLARAQAMWPSMLHMAKWHALQVLPACKQMGTGARMSDSVAKPPLDMGKGHVQRGLAIYTVFSTGPGP